MAIVRAFLRRSIPALLPSSPVTQLVHMSLVLYYLALGNKILGVEGGLRPQAFLRKP